MDKRVGVSGTEGRRGAPQGSGMWGSCLFKVICSIVAMPAAQVFLVYRGVYIVWSVCFSFLLCLREAFQCWVLYRMTFFFNQRGG